MAERKYPVTVPDTAYYRNMVKCQAACPVLTDARGYIQALARGEYELGYQIAHDPNPLSSVCGQICGAPCEAACRRGDISGPAGQQFMQVLVGRRRLPIFMVTVSFLTVIAGAILYLYSSGGFNMSWIRSGPGIGFTIGALAGLVAFFVGTFMTGPLSGKMGDIGQQVAKSGGPPTPDQLNALHNLEKRLSRAETVDYVMLTVSMITMATARYWFF